MGKYEARRATAAIEAYNAMAKASERPSSIVAAARTLLERPLGIIHFARMKEELAQREKVQSLAIWNLTIDHQPNSLRDRVLLHRVLGMGPSGTNDGDYLPHVETLTARQIEVVFCARTLPILFKSEHIEFRYLQRTAALTPYESQSFAAAMIIGTMMANVCGELRNVEGRIASVPFMLPDQNGMYLGFSASYSNKDAFDPSLKIGAGRFERGGHNPHYFECGDGMETPRAPANPPSSAACLVVNTFISHSEMSANQRSVWDFFQPIVKAVMNDQFTERFAIDYARGVFGGQSSFTEQFAPVANAVASIMSSDEWYTEMARSMPALERYARQRPSPPPTPGQ